MNYRRFFQTATGNPPYEYQVRLAEADPWPDLLEAPTGAGKTEAIVLAWLWRRRYGPARVRAATPRRLAYTLPMRVLVEQTQERVEKWIKALGWEKEVGVHLLMGGETDNDWDLYPEREAVLIGTQDMLLSRALNRGYALNRYRWPVQFGLLNNDCLWVFDEVQLMGSGLATTAQLAAFRETFGVWGRCASLWVSATLRPDWLATVDFRDRVNGLTAHGLTKSEWRDTNSDLAKRLKAEKVLRKAQFTTDDPKKLAGEIRSAHQDGQLTLVVLNTVKKATAMYEALKALLQPAPRKGKKAAAGQTPLVAAPELLLLHSRFRPPERQARMQRLRQMQETGGIVVATQVVEAGVDMSARVLFTELSPWASFVQRVGRCNRRGEYHDKEAKVFWINVKDADSAPYSKDDLTHTRKVLESLIGGNVGPKGLKVFAEGPGKEELEKLFRYEHTYVIRQHDLHSLFSTESDLAGGYTDVSNFVRNIEREADVYVYWRAVKEAPTPDEPRPTRAELCPVRLFRLKELLKKTGPAWFWNAETRRWNRLGENGIRPGMTLLLATSQGGYHTEHGWTGNPSDKPEPVEAQMPPNESLNDDPESERNDWVTLSDHILDVEAEAKQLVEDLHFDENAGWDHCRDSVVLAAWWHDVGKALPRWQQSGKNQLVTIRERAHKFLESNSGNLQKSEIEFIQSFLKKLDEPATGFWAKFPSLDQALISSSLSGESRKRIKTALGTPFLPGLRHEAASALTAWKKWQARESGWSALAVYLVACHHGKVRTVLRSTQHRKSEERKANTPDIFGTETEDRLPKIDGWLNEEQGFDLRLSTFGAIGQWNDDENAFELEEPSWIQMMAELLGSKYPFDPNIHIAIGENEPRQLGPFRLAFLEALIRAADVKASREPGRLRNNDNR